MIDFSRTYCDLHPNELVTNFCAKEECMVGLCATCICSHTQTHIQKGTAPDYENIRGTYSKMQESIRERISGLEQQKGRIGSILEVVQGKRKTVSEVVAQARNETIEFVNRFYEAKEKELLRNIEVEEKKHGLHNENRMDTLLNIISRDINALFLAAQELNSQNFLESFHRVRSQILSNSLQTQREISEELSKNESFEHTLTINPLFINQVKNALESSLNHSASGKIEQKMTTFPTETAEDGSRLASSRHSRIVMAPTPNPNEGSNLVVRRAESQPKLVQRVTAPNFVDGSYPAYFIKQSAPVQPRRPSTTDIHMLNNSIGAPGQHHHHHLNSQGSKLSVRGSSSQKMIKENTNAHPRGPMVQSFMETLQHSTPVSQPKRIKKSGLTVLRAVENDSK